MAVDPERRRPRNLIRLRDAAGVRTTLCHGTVLTAETPRNLIALHKDDPEVRRVAHGEVTLEDVFIGLTGSEIRE